MRTLAAVVIVALLTFAARADGPAAVWIGAMDKGTLERTIAALDLDARAPDAPAIAHERLVRARFFQASRRIPDKTDEQYAAFEVAVQAGLRGIGLIDRAHGGAPADADALDERLPKLDRSCVGILYWTAISYGSTIENLSVFSRAGAAKRFKRMVERCVALDETYFHGGPHRVLAGYLARAPGFMGGDVDAAKEHCERAVALDPKFADNYVQRAECVWKPAKDKVRYLADLLIASALPDDACPDAIPEQITEKKRAAEKRAKVDDEF